jgi:hypothetical protein
MAMILHSPRLVLVASAGAIRIPVARLKASLGKRAELARYARFCHRRWAAASLCAGGSAEEPDTASSVCPVALTSANAFAMAPHTPVSFQFTNRR